MDSIKYCVYVLRALSDGAFWTGSHWSLTIEKALRADSEEDLETEIRHHHMLREGVEIVPMSITYEVLLKEE